MLVSRLFFVSLLFRLLCYLGYIFLVVVVVLALALAFVLLLLLLLLPSPQTAGRHHPLKLRFAKGGLHRIARICRTKKDSSLRLPLETVEV